MTAEPRRAPVQSPRGTVAWTEHVEAWQEYVKHYQQSAERIAERGGFGYGELVTLLGRHPVTFVPTRPVPRFTGRR